MQKKRKKTGKSRRCLKKKKAAVAPQPEIISPSETPVFPQRARDSQQRRCRGHFALVKREVPFFSAAAAPWFEAEEECSDRERRRKKAKGKKEGSER